MVKPPELRTYKRQDCITFRKTAEKFGGLSNMAGGYPLLISDIRILTSEALYQACRFPHLPEVQQLIIGERSPMTAKMKSKPYRDNSRPDWDIVRTKIMRWCLQVKLVQNWDKFSKLLLETGNLPIVEYSRKDDFWGAKPQDENILVGANVLGRLLMELREKVKSREITPQSVIKPPSIPDFLLYRREINAISAINEYHLVNSTDCLDNKLNNQIFSQAVLSKYSHLGSNTENNLNNNLKEKTTKLEPELNKNDAFYIMLPHIEMLLKTEHTDKELAIFFNVPVKLMRNWLKYAVKIGKVKKLNKPVRYVADIQLSLFN